MELTIAEENYLKAIYKIVEKDGGNASTNAIAREVNTAAASVTDMLKRLSEKGLINYKKYKGVNLSEQGKEETMDLVRKHRLWETFLHETLNFTWHEVHEIAEQLEHVKSEELINRLDAFLGFPKFDPHGDPIPDSTGKLKIRKQHKLAHLEPGTQGKVVGVYTHDKPFLEHLDRLEIEIGTQVTLLERFEFDQSARMRIGNQEYTLSKDICDRIFVQKVEN